MKEKADIISEDLLDLGLKIIKISSRLDFSPEHRIIRDQLLRSGTSAGANYEDSRGAESRADFIHKLHLVYKELRETSYWSRLLEGIRSDIDQTELSNLIDKAELLIKIIGRSLITLKTRK